MERTYETLYLLVREILPLSVTICEIFAVKTCMTLILTFRMGQCQMCQWKCHKQLCLLVTATFALSALLQDIRNRLLVTAIFALSVLLQDIRSRNGHDIALTFRKGQGQM